MHRRPSEAEAAFVERYLRNRLGVVGALQWSSLAGDGSERRIYRVIWASGSLILVSHPEGSRGEISENSSYLYVSSHLRQRGIEPPLIHDYLLRQGLFILEDLGDLTLQKAINTMSLESQILDMYGKVVDVLARMQVAGRECFQPRYCYQGPVYDPKVMLEWESGYFLREFLKGYIGLRIQEGLIKKELVWLAGQAAGEEPRFFLHRDFQSRNLMLKEGRIRVLDFQGARLGPLQYDIASLMIDPYVSLPGHLQQKIMDLYMAAVRQWIPLSSERFFHYYPLIRLHRNLQILGAFAYLGSRKGKRHFSAYIPAALATLRQTLGSHPEWKCPYLRDTVELLWEEHFSGQGQKCLCGLHQRERE